MLDCKPVVELWRIFIADRVEVSLSNVLAQKEEFEPIVAVTLETKSDFHGQFIRQRN